MIELNNVTYWYTADKPVISEASAHIAEGRIYGLLGLNGSGKTTLLKLISGMLFPKKGEIVIAGNNSRNREIAYLQNIAFMPATVQLPKQSVDKFTSLNSVFYPTFSKSVLMHCLNEFDIDYDTPNLEQLSLGQKHKFMFSFLLSLGTKVLLLDEPLNGMDLPSRNAFRRLLMRHLDDSRTAVISTHVMKDIENILSDVMIIRNDGSFFCKSINELSNEYSFGISSSTENAVYHEVCPEGYKVLRKKGMEEESDIPLEILFNAVIKGGIK